jgi:hypothetical protein
MKKVLLGLTLALLLLLAVVATAAARPASVAPPRLASLSGAEPVPLLSDTFESGQTWDAGSTGWSIVTPAASFSPIPSPTHAAYAPEFGSPMLVYGPFDLSQATAATLTFELWYDSPSLVTSPYTYCGAFLIGYSTDGSDFTFPTQWSGSTGQAWQQEQVDLNSWYDQGSQSTVSLLGDSRVWIALSSSVTQPTWASSTEGSYVDDISLTATIPDSTPPVTTVSGCDANWHRTPVTLTFSATDNSGGSGVDYTEYSTDGGSAWTQGDSLTILAPANHSGDGVHTVLYKSVDNAGNWETAKSCQVKIDTRGPACAARSVTVVRGRTCRLSFKVHDALSPKVTREVTITTRSGAVKKRWSWGYGTNSASWHSFSYKCALPKGSYRIVVSGKDLASNVQSVLGKAWLYVK